MSNALSLTKENNAYSIVGDAFLPTQPSDGLSSILDTAAFLRLVCVLPQLSLRSAFDLQAAVSESDRETLIG